MTKQPKEIKQPTLKPCPLCGGEAMLYREYPPGGWFVNCKDCAGGRIFFKEQDAADHWNARPGELQWTKEPPTKKDYGHWFVGRRGRRCDTFFIDSDEAVLHMTSCTKEFFGPLPE